MTWIYVARVKTGLIMCNILPSVMISRLAESSVLFTIGRAFTNVHYYQNLKECHGYSKRKV